MAVVGFSNVQCDSITIEIDSALSQDQPLDLAIQICHKVLGNAWRVEPVEDEANEFDCMPEETAIDFGLAWEACHKLDADDHVLFAEPSFTTPESVVPDESDDRMVLRGGPSGDSSSDRPSNKRWAINKCRVPEAWAWLRENEKGYPGEGILVGHPDSGYRNHKELDPGRVKFGMGWDYVDEKKVGRAGKAGQHGLGTASVILSGDTGKHKMAGPATHAKLVPLRVAKPRSGLRGVLPGTVLLFGGMRNLKKAITRATKKGCKVISISLGGVQHRGVRKAIDNANAKGVIVIAAAGNQVKRVVFPARYKGVIAVAGSNHKDEPWSGSSWGPKVDIAAPAEDVYRACRGKNGKDMVLRGSGTSYATALTAGIAAMWRACYAEELESYEPAEIPVLFRKLLKETAREEETMSHWYGAGIVDAEKLLKAGLTPLEVDHRAKTPEETEITGGEALVSSDSARSLGIENRSDIPENLVRELLCHDDISDLFETVNVGDHAAILLSEDRLSSQLRDWLRLNRT